MLTAFSPIIAEAINSKTYENFSLVNVFRKEILLQKKILILFLGLLFFRIFLKLNVSLEELSSFKIVFKSSIMREQRYSIISVALLYRILHTVHILLCYMYYSNDTHGEKIFAEFPKLLCLHIFLNKKYG